MDAAGASHDANGDAGSHHHDAGGAFAGGNATVSGGGAHTMSAASRAAAAAAVRVFLRVKPCSGFDDSGMAVEADGKARAREARHAQRPHFSVCTRAHKLPTSRF
jgi:hypothetical protein